MKKVLFVISHLYSESDVFCKILENNPRIQFFHTNLIYSHALDLEKLVSYSHKERNSAAIWADQLLYNQYFSNKNLYPFIKFIYFFGNPRHTLCSGIKEKKDLTYFLNYYNYRLRRMYEMYLETGGIVATWENLPLEEIFDFLWLKNPLSPLDFGKPKEYNHLLEEEQLCFFEKKVNKYLNDIKNYQKRFSKHGIY